MPARHVRFLPQSLSGIFNMPYPFAIKKKHALSFDGIIDNKACTTFRRKLSQIDFKSQGREQRAVDFQRWVILVYFDYSKTVDMRWCL